MAARQQDYRTHRRVLLPYHFFVIPVLLLNAFNALRHVWLAPSLSTGWAAIVAIALLMLGVLSRVMAVTVQDRVIRLEMHLRLQEVLPADLHGRINDLTPKQLVALRFASDAELTELVREVLAGKLESQNAIKLRVRDWQADWLRA